MQPDTNLAEAPPGAISVDPHPLLDAVVFSTRFPRSLSEIGARPEVAALLDKGATNAPLSSDDTVRSQVRDLLRHGGYKPTGRGKPASEYLLRAVSEGALSSINAAVDTCNAVSYHSGLPISVIDIDLAAPPFAIRIAPALSSYAFNASGQTIDIAGLLCLFDAAGACANAVKDSQRTKTHGGTLSTLTVIWGAKALGDRSSRAFAWYRDLLIAMDATVTRWEERS